MDGKHELYAALADARKINALTQNQVAERLNVHPTTVSRWERPSGTAPSDEDLERLADLYGTTPASLKYGPLDFPSRPERSAPPVARGLPKAIRLWVEDFLRDLIQADVSEREVEEARRVLSAPELARLLSGGEPGEETEAQILRGLEGFGAAIRDTLRSRGYEIRK